MLTIIAIDGQQMKYLVGNEESNLMGWGYTGRASWHWCIFANIGIKIGTINCVIVAVEHHVTCVWIRDFMHS